MKAAILYEARQPLKIEELEMPAVGDEDVLIKVAVLRRMPHRFKSHGRTQPLYAADDFGP